MTILTKTQKETLLLLKEGRLVKDIAKELGLRPETISRAISSLRSKLPWIVEAVNYLLDIGYVSIRESHIVLNIEGRDPKEIGAEKRKERDKRRKNKHPE